MLKILYSFYNKAKMMLLGSFFPQAKPVAANFSNFEQVAEDLPDFTPGEDENIQVVDEQTPKPLENIFDFVIHVQGLPKEQAKQWIKFSLTPKENEHKLIKNKEEQTLAVEMLPAHRNMIKFYSDSSASNHSMASAIKRSRSFQSTDEEKPAVSLHARRNSFSS